jgi:aminocarboxymuconate-semialdehyde decarboxylase
MAELTNAEPGIVEASDVAARLEWMRVHGFRAQIAGPELRFCRYEVPAVEGAAWAHRLNALMAEAVAAHPNLSLLAAVPLQDGELAARELAYAVRALGFRGAMVHSRGPHRLHDRELDPFWRTASDLGVPVAVHSGAPLNDPRLDEFGLASSVGRAHEVTVAAAQLILGGVLDRFPALKVVVLMAGGTLPFLISRLDAGAGTASVKPSRHLRRMYLDTLCYGQSQIRLLLDVVGPDNLMVGSDWPIQREVVDAAGWLKELGVGEGELGRVLAGNAIEVFGLDSNGRRPS